MVSTCHLYFCKTESGYLGLTWGFYGGYGMHVRCAYLPITVCCLNFILLLCIFWGEVWWSERASEHRENSKSKRNFVPFLRFGDAVSCVDRGWLASIHGMPLGVAGLRNCRFTLSSSSSVVGR